MPATCDGHCQVPGACQDSEENEKYKIGLQDKAVDEKKAPLLIPEDDIQRKQEFQDDRGNRF
ncbi:hypothetical protein K492DRAFT_200675 [Lichtheimia hyalospora FSU 10163]|nr:hypothetical protein K492DRAFT_200675 [Lichtheimia hyalospora FSU 10163]